MKALTGLVLLVAPLLLVVLLGIRYDQRGAQLSDCVSPKLVTEVTR